LPVANFTTQDVCLSQDMVFSNNSFYNAGPMTYQWDFGDGNKSVATSPVHQYSKAGIYQVKLIAITHKECKDSLSRSVQVRTLIGADAGPDSTISKGFNIQLKASGGVQYLWSPAENLSNPAVANPNATPAATTVYKVLVTDALGCTATDQMTITVKDDFILEAMNVLTPNNDGVNDTWKIKNVESYGSASVYVYDRNGVEVFSSRAYQNDWKGNRGNDILPDGTYYYLVKFADSKVAYTGSLTILRNAKK
jgi:gliding motility-associated-like protein